MMDIKKAESSLTGSSFGNSNQTQSSSTSNSNPSAAQQILNYAAAAAAAAAAANNSSKSTTSGQWGNGNSNSLSNTKESSSNNTNNNSNSQLNAQLNAASQLIAASLSVGQFKQSSNNNNGNQLTGIKPDPESSSMDYHPSSRASSSTLLCSVCGQLCRDSSDYEQHVQSHLSMLDANQKAYQYGLHLLRMQNLMTNNNGGSPNHGCSSPKMQTSNNKISNVKKRKLLQATSGCGGGTDLDSTLNRSNQFLDGLSELQQRAALSSLLKSATSLSGRQQLDQDSFLFRNGSTIDSESIQLQLQQFAGNLLLKSSVNSALSPTTTTSTSAIPVTSSSASSSSAAMATAFPCTSCHKTFATEVDLKAHLIRHLTQHPFVCVSCGKGFKYEHSLNFHIKSYHSGNNANGNGNGGGGKLDKALKHLKTEPSDDLAEQQQQPLKLKRNSDSTTSSVPQDRKRRMFTLKSHSHSQLLQQSNIDDTTEEQTDLGCDSSAASAAAALLESFSKSDSSTKLVSSLVDENHNSMTTINHNHLALGSSVSPISKSQWNGQPSIGAATASADKLSGYFFGKPPTNLPIDSPVQIRSEKLLISLLEAVNVTTEQSLLFYKCCLCCVAFSSLDQMSLHIQNVHLPPSAAHPSTTTATAAHLLNHNNQHHNHSPSSPASPFSPKLTNAGAASATTATTTPSPNSASTTTTTTTTDSNFKYSCDKCTAKFSHSGEYEIHSQLHRIALEQCTGGGAAAGGGGYPFNFLNLNSYPIGNHQANNNGNSSAVVGSTLVDFRQILATASKDTDFGRKFAAQLMMNNNGGGNGSEHNQGKANQDLDQSFPYPGIGGTSTKRNLHHNYQHHLADSLNTKFEFEDRCSVASPVNLGSSSKHNTPVNTADNNNNSLLYLSLLPDHASRSAALAKSSSTTTTYKNPKAEPIDSGSMALNLSGVSAGIAQPIAGSKPGRASKLSTTAAAVSSASSLSSSTSSVNTLKSSVSKMISSQTTSSGKTSSKQIKEPVDIFEGAGQSLPIQKFNLGDIEETAPGQFKCRFCEKTFDRVFSVHRHERVHTGFKPCVCKTCGRGFSEKRNLRHHIIRFHSDGSGRELLKRKRKPKSPGGMSSNSATAAMMMLGGVFDSSSSMGGRGQNHRGQISPIVRNDDFSSSFDSLPDTQLNSNQTTTQTGHQTNQNPLDTTLLLNDKTSSFVSSILAASGGAGATPPSSESILNAFRQHQQQQQQHSSLHDSSNEGYNGGSLSNLKISMAQMKSGRQMMVVRNGMYDEDEDEDEDDVDGDGDEEYFERCGGNDVDEDYEEPEEDQHTPSESVRNVINLSRPQPEPEEEPMELMKVVIPAPIVSNRSRRRKSKPSKKVCSDNEEDMVDVDEEEKDYHHQEEEVPVDHSDKSLDPKDNGGECDQTMEQQEEQEEDNNLDIISPENGHEPDDGDETEEDSELEHLTNQNDGDDDGEQRKQNNDEKSISENIKSKLNSNSTKQQSPPPRQAAPNRPKRNHKTATDAYPTNNNSTTKSSSTSSSPSSRSGSPPSAGNSSIRSRSKRKSR